MTGPRTTDIHTPASRPKWPQSAAPHGYDRPEFSPEECPRDYPERAGRARPARVTDEEMRRLKAAQADMEGAPTASHPQDAQAAQWDSEDENASTPTLSRLYRE